MLSIYTESMEICKPFFSEKPLNFAKIGQDEKAGGWDGTACDSERDKDSIRNLRTHAD